MPKRKCELSEYSRSRKYYLLSLQNNTSSDESDEDSSAISCITDEDFLRSSSDSSTENSYVGNYNIE